MNDKILPEPDDNELMNYGKVTTAIAVIVFITCLLGLCVFFGWLFFEAIKEISKAWHQGAK